MNQIMESSFAKLSNTIVRKEFRGNGSGRVHNASTSFSNRHAQISTVIISDMVHALKFLISQSWLVFN